MWACSPPAPSATPVDIAPLVLPDDVGPILVLVDRLPEKEAFVEARTEQVAIGLRHFSTDTSWAYVDAATADQVASAAVVVYLGTNGTTRLGADALKRLHRARRLIVARYHLRDLREAGVAFTRTQGGMDIVAPPNAVVSYQSQTFASALPDLLDFQVEERTQVIAEYQMGGPAARRIPFIVQDGDALFVNGDLSFASSDVTTRGPMLVVCDAIAQFLGAQPQPMRPLAMLRLEDVSTVTPPARLRAIVDYLTAAHVPYGIALIPDLRIKGKTVRPLRDNDELVDVLRSAAEHKGTILLHGLHHCCSSNDAEGYEFWDYDHDSPVSYDSADWVRSQVREGISVATALGLRPLMWETPHYSASPLDYGVISEFFGAAWELRLPVGWLPWVLKRDQYGTLLLPEDLGYVSLDHTNTVTDQLAKAKELLVCRSCVAAGFLHPNTVDVSDVRQYVDGLRQLGYAFVDPADALRRYDALWVNTSSVGR